MDVNLYDSCKNADTENSLTVIHQNIRGLSNKSDELICSFTTNEINPHITVKPLFNELLGD
jgi:hypothetical protein